MDLDLPWETHCGTSSLSLSRDGESPSGVFGFCVQNE